MTAQPAPRKSWTAKLISVIGTTALIISILVVAAGVVGDHSVIRSGVAGVVGSLLLMGVGEALDVLHEILRRLPSQE